MKTKFGISRILIDETCKLLRLQLLSFIILLLVGIGTYLYLAQINDINSINALIKLSNANLLKIIIALCILALLVIIIKAIQHNNKQTLIKFNYDFQYALIMLSLFVKSLRLFTVIGFVISIIESFSVGHFIALYDAILLLIVFVFFVAIETLIELIIKQELNINNQVALQEIQSKTLSLRFIKFNWLILFATMMLGVMLTLTIVSIFHIKTWEYLNNSLYLLSTYYTKTSLVILLLTLILEIGIVFRNKISKKEIFLISYVVFCLWLLIGYFLNCADDKDFISNWINSAVAIGTIGAIITSLYLANKSYSVYDLFQVLKCYYYYNESDHLCIDLEFKNISNTLIYDVEHIELINGIEIQKSYAIESKNLMQLRKDKKNQIEILSDKPVSSASSHSKLSTIQNKIPVNKITYTKHFDGSVIKACISTSIGDYYLSIKKQIK